MVSTYCLTPKTHLEIPTIVVFLLKKLSPFHFHHCKFYSHHSLPFLRTSSLHVKAIKDGSFQNLDVANHLLNVYVKSKNLNHACKLFDEMPHRDVRTWTILVSTFAHVGSNGAALELFKNMQNEGIKPNQFTLSSVLKCCSSLSELKIGKGVHGWILRNGVVFDVILENALFYFYVKCEDFGSAKWLFESMEEKNSVTWNIMIGAYLDTGNVDKAVDLFRRQGLKDVSVWNTIINGLMRNGFERIALKLLYEMVKDGTLFNEVTFSIALVLVSLLKDLELGKRIHGRVLLLGIHVDGFLRNSLIDMYCKCGEMKMALKVFEKMDTYFGRNENSIEEVISWSSIISGLVLNGEFEDAFKTFTSMVHKDIDIDAFSITSIVSACASFGVLELGRQVHGLVQKMGHKLDAHLGSSLIDMYAKCGNLDDAERIFKQTNDMNVVLWTSMVYSYALHGRGREAVQLFEFSMSRGLLPNEVTFIGVLTACSHAGLVEEGCRYFRLMKEVYGIKPGVEHFTRMVDLYGRAGRFKEIKKFIDENGIHHLRAVWRSFLSSCRLHRDIEMAEWVSENLLRCKTLDARPYVLLSNIYAIKQRWEEVETVRRLMQSRGVKKHPCQSWIQIRNQVHAFIMDDRSHPQKNEICAYLYKLIGRLRKIGYSSDAKLVMQDVEKKQGEGEMLLGFHSEKLATAYGIISTASQTPIRIMKNLRICDDCHNFMKYTSQLLDKEIIVRDIHRFHHFKHGCCSCGDYW
ncbi:hypothetical protein CXB51_020770 [Gossypium anomalum]|uniref:DYW domain-containing protein n=1 Tax=Gossypium anomalum TaxID=47600 RepID=A0A8J5YKI7_9ROSI|nr:hypothetical protein CXB51_020770 [Gossypium anomalum]